MLDIPKAISDINWRSGNVQELLQDLVEEMDKLIKSNERLMELLRKNYEPIIDPINLDTSSIRSS